MAVVDFCITAGQSLMSGFVPFFDRAATTAMSSSALASELVGSDLVPVVDPRNDVAVDNMSYDVSCVPRFAQVYTAYSQRPLVLVRTAVGGTALLAPNEAANGNWSPTGDLYDDSVALALACMSEIASAGHTIGNAFVIWSQGYRDAIGGKDASGAAWPANDLQADYTQAMLDILTNWRTDLSLPGLQAYSDLIYIPPPDEGNAAMEAKLLALRQAQIDAVAAGTGWEFGFVSGETYADLDYLSSDNLHYSQAGYIAMGEEYGVTVATDHGYEEPGEGSGSTIDSPCSPIARRLLGAPRVEPLPRTYDTPGTYEWVVPNGVTSIDYVLTAGGGGGKGGGLTSSGGGGAGEGEERAGTLSVTPGDVYEFVIGDGGTGINYATAGSGQTGADSKIDGVTTPGNLVTAKGGQGGGVGTARQGGIGGTGGSGGTGTAGAAGASAVNSINSSGGDGGAASGSTTAPLGPGRGGITGDVAGKTGTVPGGGGGGGRGNVGGAHGAKGAAGQLTITDTTP